MKKKLWYTLLTVALIVVLASSLAVGALADDDDADYTVSSNGMTLFKKPTVQEDGTYILDLEAFTTGEVTTSYETVPVDIILVLDVSGSMDGALSTTYQYTERDSQGYTYYNSVDSSGYYYSYYYYQHTDGNYYPVQRNYYWTETGSGPNHQYVYHFYLFYDADGTRYYLSGTESTTTRPDNYTDPNGTIWTGVLYSRTTVTETKMDALQTAVNGFIDIVAEKNADDAVKDDAAKQSRVAIVKFAMDKTKNDSSYADYQNNIGDDTYYDSYYEGTYNYTQVVNDLAVVTNANKGALQGKVNALTAAGATSADYGMAYAEAIFDKYPIAEGSDRTRVVVMFTDGEPNHSSGFSTTVANSAITSAKTLKDAGAKVFSVAVLEGANPALDPAERSTSDVNKYLHAVSSNYPSATSYTSLGDRAKTDDGKDANFYFTAATSSQLEGIFAAIAQQSGATTTEVSSTAVLKDIVSSSFTLPENATAENITVKIVRWNSYQHRWGTADDTTGGPYVFTPDDWKTACHTYGAAADAEENVQVTINPDDGKTIDITGFDYSTHYKATTSAQDNDAVDQVNSVNKNTAKIVVSFPILAKPSAVTGGSVATNGEESGLYVDGEVLLRFPQPKVTFTPITYVVDYVNLPTNGDNKPSTITLDYSKVLKNVQMLDEPGDEYLIGVKVDEFKYTIYKGDYGTISFGDDADDVNKKMRVRYSPTTMDWNDYDRIFIKGESADPKNPGNVWAMLAVMPANSVYYEDSFVTTTKHVEYGKDKDGNPYKVDIEYTGITYDEGKWALAGAEGLNSTQHAGSDMGWIEGLADDTDYSNGGAHTSSTAKAKASFTFSGTGVDIYSRTNGTTGTVVVLLKGTAANGSTVSKAKTIDTKAASGDYYQIPVCTFTDLPYGKYTATITVTAGAQKEGRMTFYLDGVRVYNPIQPHESEEVIQKVYGKTNLNAVFTEVRSMLVGTGATAGEGVFIDELTTTTTEDPDPAAVEAAAKALAEEQAALDVELQKLEEAKAAVASAAAEIADAEDDIKDADEEIAAANAILANEASTDEEKAAATAAKEKAEADKTKAEAEKAAAEAKKTAAEPDVTTAQAAVDAKKPDVEEARAAYDAANTSTEVTKTTTNIADYTKDGPKSEVYLDKNQAVVLSLESGNTYYVGLKEITGSGTKVKINNEEKPIPHTSDLYYKVEPVDGTVTITNIGDGILSVTKLRTTDGDGTSGAKTVSTESLLKAFRSMSAMSVTDYTGDVMTEDEATAPEEVVVEETTPEETEEVTEVALDEDDITIENPETEETAAEETTESEPAQEETTQSTTSSTSSWYNFLSSFFGFFRRR